MSRYAEDREREWRDALADLGFKVTSISGSGNALWIRAKDENSDAYQPYLRITDAWDDNNEVWSYGFSLSEDGSRSENVEYDGDRVNVPWLCSMIEASRS